MGSAVTWPVSRGSSSLSEPHAGCRSSSRAVTRSALPETSAITGEQHCGRSCRRTCSRPRTGGGESVRPFLTLPNSRSPSTECEPCRSRRSTPPKPSRRPRSITPATPTAVSASTTGRLLTRRLQADRCRAGSDLDCALRNFTIEHFPAVCCAVPRGAAARSRAGRTCRRAQGRLRRAGRALPTHEGRDREGGPASCRRLTKRSLIATAQRPPPNPTHCRGMWRADRRNLSAWDRCTRPVAIPAA